MDSHCKKELQLEIRELKKEQQLLGVNLTAFEVK